MIGIAFDGTAHTMKVYKNNVLKATVSSMEASAFFACVGLYDTPAKARLSTYASQFAYTPPSGYSAWDS